MCMFFTDHKCLLHINDLFKQKIVSVPLFINIVNFFLFALTYLSPISTLLPLNSLNECKYVFHNTTI